MKNSIFKSYSKKILKSEAFVSVIIVFVLAIGIISTSYALYMDVDKDTDYQLVQVGDLSIGFDKGDNTISLSNMTPSEDDIALKQTDNIFSFYIYNTGTYTADYNIKLVTTDGNEVDKQYINFRICKDNTNNCDDIKTLSDITDDIIYNDELAPKKSGDATNPSSYYFIRIWINNKYTNTTSKNIKLKVVVDASNASGELDNKNTLAGRILNDSRIKINNDTPDMSKIETEEKGLYTAPDDYGTTYYFRGAQTYNYVNFAGMCFRIVRIQGDGSIKLILASEKTCSTSNLTTSSGFATNGAAGTQGTMLTAHYGYKNVVVGSKTYKINDYINSAADTTGNARTKLNAWLARKITSTSDLALLKEETWCIGDQTNAYSINDTGEIVGTVSSLINSGTSFEFAAGNKYWVTNTPSFKCETTGASGETDTNKVGMLTMDEIAYAGAGYNDNYKYYLNDNATTTMWWTLSPSNFGSGGSGVFLHSLIDSAIVNTSNSIRPVVTLVAGTLINGGDGTISNPYTLKLY